MIAILVTQGLGNALVPAWTGLEQAGFNMPRVPSAVYVRSIQFMHASVAGHPLALDLLRSVLVTGG